jgi:hypothetical protein
MRPRSALALDSESKHWPQVAAPDQPGRHIRCDRHHRHPSATATSCSTSAQRREGREVVRTSRGRRRRRRASQRGAGTGEPDDHGTRWTTRTAARSRASAFVHLAVTWKWHATAARPLRDRFAAPRAPRTSVRAHEDISHSGSIRPVTVAPIAICVKQGLARTRAFKHLVHIPPRRSELPVSCVPGATRTSTAVLPASVSRPSRVGVRGARRLRRADPGAASPPVRECRDPPQ